MGVLMSKLEYYLWGADFMIGGIGWFFGGPYAGLVCFVIGGILILIGLTKGARPRWRRAMFDTVEKIHGALGIESTWLFVLIIAVGFGFIAAIGSGGVAWIVDRAYKRSSEYKAEHPDRKQQTVIAATSNPTSQGVTVQGSATQGVQGGPSAPPPVKGKSAKRLNKSSAVSQQQEVPQQQTPLRESLPKQTATPVPSPIPAIVNAPDGIAIGGNNYGDPTVNNYSRTEITYPYDGSCKKVSSGASVKVIVNSPPNTPNPLYTKMQDELNARNWQEVVADAQSIEASDPMWATPHILAALAFVNLGDQSSAKIENRKARELVPEGYEFEAEYAPHLQHLEEAIKRHEKPNALD
jgi:hypothetical protein